MPFSRVANYELFFRELTLTIKVLVVFGTRPEAIKMAPVCKSLLQNDKYFKTIICVTGQHREMLDQVLDIFDIKPDIDLSIMKAGQDLTDVTSSILTGMRKVISDSRPDLVLVHGDTTTTLATSIAAFYAQIPIGHVEAGLRTNNISVPFPEEFNRQVTSKITRWHFSPTASSRENLVEEGCPPENIVVTGNTVIDSLLWVLKRIEDTPDRKKGIVDYLTSQLPFDWQNGKFILITGHRRENFGEGFINICKALVELATKFPHFNFVYPVHLNPNVQTPVNSTLGGFKNIHLINPLDYEPFVYLLKNCYLVLTDSGGIQEEAPSVGKPVLVMRDVTERPEAVQAGTVKLVGTNVTEIVSNVEYLIEDQLFYQSMSLAHNPYGDGKASDRIVEVIKGAHHARP
jgi:UDP-N-acetylglucosamine 2-epimerase (non-hydrolysing)